MAQAINGFGPDHPSEEQPILEKRAYFADIKRSWSSVTNGVSPEGKRGSGGAMSGRTRHVLGLLSLLIFVLAWHLVATNLHSPYLPRPAAVAHALLTALTEKDFLGYTIGQHTLASLLRIVYGFALALAIAVPLGLGAGWFQTLAALTAPLVEILRPIPPLAWIPFAIYFFGSPFDAVFLVVLAAFFPVFLNSYAGVRAIQPALVDAARTLGARRLGLFAHVVVPATLGSILTGARIGLGIAWMSIVAAEMVGVKGGGLGVYVWSMAQVGRFDAVFAGMVLIGLLGMLLTGAIGLGEQRYVQRGLSDA